MLYNLNRFLEKFMPVVTPLSVLVGVLLSVHIKDLAFLIPWIFAMMTFAGSLGSNIRSLKEAVLNPLPIIVALFLLHFIMPLWAWGVGLLVFQDDIFTVTGLLLGMAIPTGITSLIWVSIYKGNVPLTLSIILIDTLLSPFLVPYTMSIMIGQRIEMDITSIMIGLLGMIVIPSIIGMLLNHLTKGRIKEVWGPRLNPCTKIGLAIVVMLNGAVVAPHLSSINLNLVLIGAVVFFIAMTGYMLAFGLGTMFNLSKETVVALTFTGGMRNISAGAVLAVSYFPAAVAVPVVIGMLFQQVLASTSGYLVNRFYSKKTDSKVLSA